MFIHSFKYALKTLFKNKMLIFWTFAFPIILGTFFNLAFSNIETNEKLDIIDIAIVDNEDFNKNEIYKETFKSLSDGENKLFNIKYINEEESIKLLKDKEISGYIIFNNSPKVVVLTSGINETIIKQVLESIAQTKQTVENLIKIEVEKGNDIDYAMISNDIISSINSDVNIKDISSSNLSYTMIEFYTLIALTCLYAGTIGMYSINKCLANMSNNGKRVAVSPISKFKLIFSNLLASYITQLIGLFLLFIYTIFVLNIDYGNNIPLIILLSLVGSLSGLSLGVLVSSVFKTNENVKIGIIISITMVCCFLSGMMGITMKYVVDKNIPILNKINPASMITDGFYSLYYYDTLDRYYSNIISLLIFAFVMIFISMFSLRRQKYDSI